METKTSAVEINSTVAITPVCKRHHYITVYTKGPMQGTRVQLYCTKCGMVKDGTWRNARL